jgi:hypothetical protein
MMIDFENTMTTSEMLMEDGWGRHEPDWLMIEEVRSALEAVTNADYWVYDAGEYFYLDDDAEEQILTEQQLKVVSVMSGVQIELVKDYLLDYIGA